MTTFRRFFSLFHRRFCSQSFIWFWIMKEKRVNQRLKKIKWEKRRSNRLPLIMDCDHIPNCFELWMRNAKKKFRKKLFASLKLGFYSSFAIFSLDSKAFAEIVWGMGCKKTSFIFSANEQIPKGIDSISWQNDCLLIFCHFVLVTIAAKKK